MAQRVTSIPSGMIAQAMRFGGKAVGEMVRGYQDAVADGRDGMILDPTASPDAPLSPAPQNPGKADPPPGGRPSNPFTLDHFGPGRPLMPDPSMAFSTFGRTWDFMAGLNLTYTPKTHEGVPYPYLKSFARADYLLRYCINTREDQLCSLPWSIQKETAKQSDKQDPDAADIERRLRNPGQPDSLLGYTPFTVFLRKVIEDLLVIDSPAILNWQTKGGDVFRLKHLDGSLVHPLYDSLGDIPEPPMPAYQVILKGRPAYNVRQDQLLWMPRNVQPGYQYGFSLVEQSLMILNIALRRDIFMLNYFTEGNIGDAAIFLPTGMTDEQIKLYLDSYDAKMADNLKQRRKLQWLPGGPGASIHEFKGEAIKTPFDEWRARAYCAIWSLPHTPFDAGVTKGESRDDRDEAHKEGLIPFALAVEERMNLVLAIFFHRPDLKFRFKISSSTNPVEQANADKIDITTGVSTIAEVREARGKPPIKGGDRAFVSTPNGLVPVEELEKATFDAPAGGKSAPTPATDEVPPDTPGGKASGRESKTKPAGGDNQTKSTGEEDDDVLKGTRAGRLRAPRNPHLSAAADRLKDVAAHYLHETGVHAATHVANHPDLPKPRSEGETFTKDQRAERAAAIAKIVKSVNLTGLQGLVAPFDREMRAVGQYQAAATLKTLRDRHHKAEDSTGSIFRADSRVLAYASSRSAELVGMRRDADGNLVPNPNPDMAIDEVTRQKLRADIEDALGEGLWPRDLVNRLEESYNFSEYRARLIADTEISMANANATMAAWSESGVVRGKSWILSEDHDPKVPDECDANAAAGEVPIDSAFPSGDLTEPAHPGCTCGIEAVLDEAA